MGRRKKVITGIFLKWMNDKAVITSGIMQLRGEIVGPPELKVIFGPVPKC